MDSIKTFGVIGQLAQLQDAILSQPTPELRARIGRHLPLDANKETIYAGIMDCLAIVERDFDRFEPEFLKVNELLDQYLQDLCNAMREGHYEGIMSSGVSSALITLGHRGGAFGEMQSVSNLLDVARQVFDRYHTMSMDEVMQQGADIYVRDARLLQTLYYVLDRLDDFITSYQGACSGVTEFAPVDYDLVESPPVTDWVSGLECIQTDACGCGCSLNHQLKLLEGMEDFLAGEPTSACDYFMVTAKLNGLDLQNVAGQEAISFDTVKEMAKKAYDAIIKAWESVKEWWNVDESELEKELVATAENNKKAIQKMPQKDVKINNNAKQGLGRLAEKADESGDLTKVVQGFNGPADASKVIDGLLAVMRKHSKTGTALQNEKKAAEKTMDDLKASIQSPGKGTDEEAVKVARTTTQEKIKVAKQSVAKAKKMMQQHNKITAGIKNAINGITPHIFISENPEDGKGDTGNKEPKT